MENVAALVSDKFIGTFNQWQLELERYGYTNFSQVLNAKNYGVPQNRERIFMVSVLNCEQAFYFPAPIPLTKRLKDVLETEVDEKYYLSDKVIEGWTKNNLVVEQIVLGWSRDEKGNVVDRHPVDVANCVTAAKRDNTQNFVVEPNFRIRKLTERECFRLMGVIDTDSDKIRAAVSKSQCYKLAGNSIVVDVMVGIFEQLLIGNKNTNQQLEIF